MPPRLAIVAFLTLVTGGLLLPAESRVPASVEDAIEQVTVDELRAHITVLASDRLKGRGVGDEGNSEAERYIAGALKAANVAAAAPGYLQPVEVYQPRLGDNSKFTARAGADPLIDLTAGTDFFPLPESADRTVTGRIVFAGHGLTALDLKHDDYAGANVAEAIVVALEDLPDALQRSASLSADQKAEMGAVERKAHDARAHGAAGLLVVRQHPGSVDYYWPPHPSIREADYRLYADMRAHPLAVAAISDRIATMLRRAADRGVQVSATLNPQVVARPITIDNVLGMLEGRQASQQMVVVGAHLDHDGTDEAGQIYNGADDNASGTAAVLAIAAALERAAARGLRPARTVVFALWNGEEKGELGAEFYVQHPVPDRQIVANINLDMVGRDEDIPDPNNPRFRGFEKTSAARNTNVVHLLGYSYSPELARMVERANESVHLTIKQDYDYGSQGLVRRSDDWPFLERRIPAVFLTTGLHPDYHTPDDDVDRIDFGKLERITELAARLAWIAADGEAPRFNAR